MKARAISLALALGALAGCTRSGLRIDEKDPTPPAAVKITVPEGFGAARDRLRAYLLERGRVEAESNEPVTQFRQPWVRDTSLRYYMLEFDRRRRHAVSWQGLWTIKPATATTTELKLEILEVVFLGPPNEATEVPDEANEEKEWFEAEPDSLRASLELKRYWRDSYAGHVMPPALTDVTAPRLEGPPKAREIETKGRWTPLSRPRAF